MAHSMATSATPKCSDPWAITRKDHLSLHLRQTDSGIISGTLHRPAAQQPGTPVHSTWLNELKRLTSGRSKQAWAQFARSLPLATKVFFVVSILNALYLGALSIEQLALVRERERARLYGLALGHLAHA